MNISTKSFFEEMNKLSEVTSEQAEQALKRLKTLEENKPTVGQLGRGALVGSAAGPVAGTLSKVIAGGWKKGIAGNIRDVAGQAASGAVFGGGIPYVRHNLEHRAEGQLLKEYAGQRRRGRLRGQIKKTLGL